MHRRDVQVPDLLSLRGNTHAKIIKLALAGLLSVSTFAVAANPRLKRYV